MNRIFTYILHKDGVIDDTAFELIAAAREVDPTVSPIAVVAGFGRRTRPRACDSLRGSYREIWKIDNQELAHSNAEAVRQALVKVLPTGSILLLAHEHFGIDLAPGLSIKLHAPYVPDVLNIEAEPSSPETGSPGVWRTNQYACPLRYFFGSCYQHSPGCIQGPTRYRG